MKVSNEFVDEELRKAAGDHDKAHTGAMLNLDTLAKLIQSADNTYNSTTR